MISKKAGSVSCRTEIFADDRRGLLLDVSKVFTEEKIDVKSMNTRTSKKGTATMEMGICCTRKRRIEPCDRKAQTD